MDIEIRDDAIRLGQLLKLAGVVGGGGEAAALIADGEVLVDGEVETRRGAQIRVGQTVTVAGQDLTVVHI